MNRTVKRILKKTTWVMVTFIFLEALLLMGLKAIYILSEYKLAVSSDLVIKQMIVMLRNLPYVIEAYWIEKNPFFILGTFALFIYSLVLHARGKADKEGWETHERNAYHGSAHWGSPREIFDKTNFFKQTKSELQKDFMESLDP